MLASVTTALYSIGKALEWSFETLLVPISDPLNWLIFAMGMVAMVYWLMLQKKYNEEAKKNNSIK